MEIQLHAAYADGSVDASVRSILSYVARRLGFSELQLTQMEAMVQAALNFSSPPGERAGVRGAASTTSPSPYPLPQRGRGAEIDNAPLTLPSPPKRGRGGDRRP